MNPVPGRKRKAGSNLHSPRRKWRHDEHDD
jgi:hypothetical protein